MDGKRSNPVLFLLLVIYMISFSNAELQHQTLFLNEDDARSALYRTASSIPPGSNVLSMEMIRSDDHPSFAANNVNLSRSDIMKNRLERDQMRVESLAQQPSSTANTLPVSSNSISSHLARLGVGTPAWDLYMILDTGSDLIWLQCEPCTNCYNQTDPIFNPVESHTYQEVPCQSKTCMLLDPQASGCELGICQYQQSYGDGSFTIGNLANETLTLGDNIRVAGIALGCGHDNEGTFAVAAGILGLGGENLSLPNQLADHHQYRRKFAYCLVSRGSSDKFIITFGQTPLSDETHFTPMLTNKGRDTSYYVNLTGISVGGSNVQGMDSLIPGGVIIDSGTTLTYLEESAYNAVRDVFRSATDKLNLTLAPPPHELKNTFDTCYNFSSVEIKKVSVPAVGLHFDGVDMQLGADNCLTQVDDYGTFCFAFAPSNRPKSIIGNIQQQGFQIMFDLETSQIGITPESC